jgi:trans-2-enoyl-CoA reductase
MTKGDYIEKQWNSTSTTDMFTLSDYKKYKNLVFDLSFFNNARPIALQMKGLHLKVFGVK